jgi:hypothetical protein
VVDTNGLRLIPFDPDFYAALKAVEQTRRKYRSAFRAPAK